MEKFSGGDVEHNLVLLARNRGVDAAVARGVVDGVAGYAAEQGLDLLDKGALLSGDAEDVDGIEIGVEQESGQREVNLRVIVEFEPRLQPVKLGRHRGKDVAQAVVAPPVSLRVGTAHVVDEEHHCVTHRFHGPVAFRLRCLGRVGESLREPEGVAARVEGYGRGDVRGCRGVGQQAQTVETRLHGPSFAVSQLAP